MDLSEQKFPKGEDKHIGLEIELVSPFEREHIKKLLDKSPIKNNIQVKGDSSIKPDGFTTGGSVFVECKKCLHYCNNHVLEGAKLLCDQCGQLIKTFKTGQGAFGHELNFVFKEKDIVTFMKQVHNILKTIKASANKSCGLHVHLDMRKRDAAKCFTNLVTSQDLLYKLVAKNRRRNSYCKKVPKNTSIIKDGEYRFLDVPRHSAINPQAVREHNTIEVRLHHGTVDVKEIYNWTKTLIAIVEGRKFSATLLNYHKAQQLKVA
jgi:Putative amidoligase enzyme